MEKYKNLDGDSGVAFYEIGIDFIKVQFTSGSIYLYTYESAGSSNIEIMKELALNGKGLNSFISRTVRSKYASILRK